nr:hypothetical protein [Tanacetum cinerariifolium]
MDGHTKFAGTLAWSSSMIYLGSRDTSILQRDPRAHESFVSKLNGHKSDRSKKWSQVRAVCLELTFDATSFKVPLAHCCCKSTHSHLSCVNTDSQVCLVKEHKRTGEHPWILIKINKVYINSNKIKIVGDQLKLAIVKGHIDRVLHLLISLDEQTIMTGAGNGILRFRNVFPPCRSQVELVKKLVWENSVFQTCVNQLGSSRIKFTQELKPLRIFSFDGDWNLCPVAARGNLRDCKGSKQAAEDDSEYLLEDKLQEICEKHYKQILPIIKEKVHREKLQGVQTRLTYGESSHQNTRTREETQFSEIRREGDKPTRRRSLVSTTMFTRLGHRDVNVFTHLGKGRRNVHSRLGPKVAPRHRHASERRSACSNRSEDLNRRKEDARSLIRSYVTCSSERRREIEEEWYAADRANRRQLARIKEAYLSEDENNQGGHWKSRPKKRRSNGEDDLSQPRLCKETDPFTARIRYFEVPKNTRMPTSVKTHDGTGDPEDHLQNFLGSRQDRTMGNAHLVLHVQLYAYRLSQSLVRQAPTRIH